MFANEYQGGTHVEVLGTQGQNPLGQWKVSGPQKGIQKIYDKALKCYVFTASGGCRLALPKDERAALGLTQPHLLLQLEVGVGVPFNLEMGLTDASGTRRRMILSSSFSELKCTPLHCQVPFASVPREAWLNLVLPMADLAAVLFRPAGASGGASSSGGGTGGGAGGTGLGGAAAAAFYRSLDSLQLAGTCRLRRIATLRDLPQPADAQDAGGSPAPTPKPLDFPPGVEFQTLLLDPRSLSFVSLTAGNNVGLLGTPTSGGGASGSGGLGVVGTSTGSARRAAPSGGSLSGAAAAASAAAASAQLMDASHQRPPPGPSGSGSASGSAGSPMAGTGNPHGDSGSRSPTGGGSPSDQLLTSASAPHCDGSTHGSPGGGRHSTPHGREAAGAAGAPGPPHAGHQSPGSHPGIHQHPHGEHMPPSRLSRSSGAGPITGALTAPPSPLQQHPQQHQPQQQQAQSATGPGPGPGPGSEGSSGKLPQVHVNAAALSDDANGGDPSAFGGRRAVSANTVTRYGTSNGASYGTADPAGTTGPGEPAAAAGAGGAAGGGAGPPRSPPWPRSVMGKRAQSGPARISTETLSQGLGETSAPHEPPSSPSLASRAARRVYNAAHLPPTISEHEAMPPMPANGGGQSGAAGPPACKSPSRSPTRARPPAAAANSASFTGSATPSSSSLPLLRAPRNDAGGGGGGSSGTVNGRETPSPVAGACSGALGAQLSSLLTVRGGVDASIDFATAQQSVLLENGPGSPSFLSALHRVNSMRAHRYGGGGAAAGGGAASGASADMSSDSDDGGGGSGGAAAKTAHDTLPVNVPRIRTRMPAGGTGNGGGGVKGGEGSGPHPGAGSASRTARKAPGANSDADTPTRAGRTASVTGPAGQSGRVSPVNTPTRAGAAAAAAGGRMAPPPISGTGAEAGPGSGRPAREDAGAAAAGASARAAAAAGSASGAAAGRRPGSGGAGTPGSPVRQRAAAATPPRAARGVPKPPGGSSGSSSGAVSGSVPLPTVDARDRLPPLAGNAARARGVAASGGVAGSPGGPNGRGSHIPKPGPHPPQSNPNPNPARAPRAARSASTREVDVEESITLTAGIWGGFGVDEDDDVLGSRHFRSSHAHAASRSDEHDYGDSGGAVAPSGPSFGTGTGSWGVPAAVASPRRIPGAAAAAEAAWDGGMHLPPVGVGGPSPPATAASGGRGRAGVGGGGGTLMSPLPGMVGEEPMSPPMLYPHHANAPLSPPIRRSGLIEAENGGGAHRPGHHHPPLREATFSGFVDVGAGGGPGQSSGGGAAKDGGGGVSVHPWGPLLDEEALLAGHTADPVSYDDWGRVDQRPTPHDFANSHRLFTPPVVPASRALGVGLGDGTAAGGADAGPQVLRVEGGSGGTRGQGVVAPAGGEAMLDLVYDPVLNCYYDGTTGQYYELKT